MKEAILPLVPIAWAVIWALRAANGTTGSRGGGGSARTGLRQAAGSFTTAQALVRFCIVPSAPFGFAALLSEPTPASVFAAFLLACVCAPTLSTMLIARILPVPAGFYLAWCVAPHWTRSIPHAGAVILLARARRLARAQAEWLVSQMQASPHRYALSFVAWGAVHANQGEREKARAAMRIAASMPAVPGVEPARSLARDWLLAEAIERGDWDEARDAVSAAPQKARSKALATLVDALECGGKTDTIWTIGQLLWRPRLALALLRLPEPRFELQPTASAFARARAWQARALSQGRFADVRAAAEAWDDVLQDAALRARLSERAGALRLPDGGGVLDEFVAAREAELAERLLAARRFPSGPGVLGRAGDRAWETAWRELDDRCRDFHRFGDNPHQLIPHEESFFAYEPIRRLAEAMVRDRPTERLVLWRRVCDPVLHTGATLYNQHGQHYFGAVTFRWLRAFGDGVMSPNVQQVLDKNIGLT